MTGHFRLPIRHGKIVVEDAVLCFNMHMYLSIMFILERCKTLTIAMRPYQYLLAEINVFV
jgi:hypothetical protein